MSGDCGLNVPRTFSSEAQLHQERLKEDVRNCERQTLNSEESIVALRESQLEYRKISDSIKKLRDSFSSSSPREATANSSKLKNPDDNSQSLYEANDFEDYCSSHEECVIKWSDAITNDTRMRDECLKTRKLDALIKKLNKKVKEAGEETSRMQWTNRKELKKLLTLRAAETGELARNSERFLKLYPMKMEDTGDIANETDEIAVKSRNPRKAILENKPSEIENEGSKFIRRNKESAVCPMGSLSTTKKEKERLADLTDVTDAELIDAELESLIANPHAISEDTEKLLDELKETIVEIRSVSQEEINKLVGDYSIQASSHAIELEVSEKIIENEMNEDEITAMNEFADELNGISATASTTTSSVRNIPQDIVDELLKEANVSIPLWKLKSGM